MRRLKIWNLAALAAAGLGLWLGLSWSRPTESPTGWVPSPVIEKIARPITHEVPPSPENGSPTAKKRV